MTYAAARSSCPATPPGLCTAPGLLLAAGANFPAVGTGGLPGIPGAGGAAGGLAAPPTLGLAGITGLGLGAGGGPLWPIAEVGREPTGVDEGEGVVAAAAAACFAFHEVGPLPLMFAAGAAGAAGAGGGRRVTGGGGGGGGADSTTLRLTSSVTPLNSRKDTTH
jgi:hypothetical protein